MSPSRPLATVFLLALCGTAFAAGSFTLTMMGWRGRSSAWLVRKL